MHSGNLALVVGLSFVTGWFCPAAWAKGTPVASATADEDLEDAGARAIGSGMVGIANPNDVSAMRLSLATASLTERYEIFSGAELGPDKHFSLRGGAVDSRSSVVAIGLGYRRLTDAEDLKGQERPGWQEPDESFDNPTEHQGFYGGVAYPFVPGVASVAAHARYDWYASDQLGEDAVFNFGFSAAWRPAEQFTMAAAIDNLLENQFRDTERELRVGARVDPGAYLGLEFNALAPIRPTWDWQKLDWRVGANVGIAEVIGLRAGYANNHTKSWVCGGLAFISEKAEIDYGLRVRVDAPRNNVHALDVRLKF